VGRYEPEELDELGKPTGRPRIVPIDPKIQERSDQLVAQLVGMFADPPVQPRDDRGRPKPPTREEIEKVTTLVEVETLQHEVYQLWGVALEVEERRKRSPIEVFDELNDLVARGLSEQRERMLDLADRVVSAVVEESCPPNKPPEDWDWSGIRQAFREHFKEPPPSGIDALGTPEGLVRELYAAAEAIYRKKEEELGVDLALRVFRHIYLEAIDEAWVDHLSNMEHLRDGIGLRGYGQRDPKNEYKKEAYNMFLNMMAKVSSIVLSRVFEVQIQRQEEIAAIEAEAEARHQAELEQAVARHPGEEPPASPTEMLDQMREAATQLPVRAAPSGPKIGRNDPCPCGSGKKFKKCHGAVLEEDSPAP
jgi:preprotein translocase subunit SecA